jgi:hypothetical protein
VVYFMTGASDYTTSDTYLVSNRSAASWRGEADNEEVGYSVAGVGDFNGDGFGDFAIARKSQTSSNQAIAYLFFGGNFPTGDSDISSVAPVSFSGESLNCPCTVASAGDMNGDDLGDFVIGVSKSDLGGTDSGAVYLFLGREEPAYGAVSLNDADGVFIGSAGELAGSGLAGLGDINGDGYSDLGIGAPMADNGGSTNVGRTYVLFGLAR